MIASQVLALVSLVFWLVIAGLSVMAFDSGMTTEAWIFVIAAWVAYARKRDRLAGILITFTFLPVLVLLLILTSSSFFYSMGI